MGLCKCPKRKVTNQFCFEHRVNVCEYCMVSNHQFVRIASFHSYVTAALSLTGSKIVISVQHVSSVKDISQHRPAFAYNAISIFSDVFHWSCLDLDMRSQTDENKLNRCPTCQGKIFPDPSNTSPVSDALKSKLSLVNWGRLGLGLDPLPEEEDRKNVHIEQRPEPVGSSSSPPQVDKWDTNKNSQNVSQGSFHTNNYASPQTSRRLVDSADSSMSMFEQSEEPASKYRRRTVRSPLQTWWRSITGPPHPRGNLPLLRRYGPLLALIFFLAFIFFVLLLWLNRGDGEYDPLFDPLKNPHIRIEK
ncbi:unnamed protein product [Darwinula stevensoni]|uniref:Zinc finger protein-like 1 homolog n=1 Tax=Darwinula stevensoni TaxID=69355 RepID=A0A7R8X2M9_9CRUS|nr:unnamed protein product [Darwinula stevensoni]CAG0883497.1 unnamed protein product [Darwinula stevensoni]